MTSLLDALETYPWMRESRGKWRRNAALAPTVWFRAGGAAEFLFRPADSLDLAQFLASRPTELPYTVIGAGSNLLVRDGGVRGVVIRPGGGFHEMLREGDRLVFGAGCLNANAALFAQQQSLGGIEFLSGIPGSIGGALRMNAGAYGAETKDRLLEAEALDPNGNLHRLKVGELGYGYRACGLPEGWIFTRAVFQGICEPDESIRQRMEAIAMKRAASQPLRARTGGSTFKNPPGAKAWELIDKAGCRGLRHGEAQMSELHCNFLINTGNASASDIEELGETVRARVLASSGVALEWEIKRIGLVWRSSGALCR